MQLHRILAVLLCCAGTSLRAQTLQTLGTSPMSRDTSPKVELFADGNVKSVISQPSDVTTAAGTVGLRYVGTSYVATGVVSVGAKVDTLRRGFGATMLTPGTGGALNAGILDIRRRHVFGLDGPCTRQLSARKLACSVGLHGYLTIGSSRWATHIDTMPAGAVSAGASAVGDTTFRVTGTADVPTWGSGLGLSYEFFNWPVRENGEDVGSAAMVFDFGVATRHLRGDLYSQDALRNGILGTTRRNFVGLEGGLGLQYRMVRAGVQYYYMSGDVNGFSHGQVAAGISIQATLRRFGADGS